MKKQILPGLLFFLLFNAPTATASRFVFDANCRNAYQSMITLKLPEARALLLTEKIVAKQNVLPVFLESYCDFIQCVIDEDKGLFDKLTKKEKQITELWEETPDPSPFRLYVMAEAKLQWALMKAKFGDVFHAALDLNDAYHLYSRNEELFPTFAPNKKGLGILHTLFGLVPEEYSWLMKMLGYKGTVSQGLSELVYAFAQTYLYPEYRFMRTELLFVISFVHINLFHSKEDLDNIQKYLIREARNEPLLLFARINIEMKTGNNDKALSLIQQWPTGASYYPFIYIEYLKGTALLHKLDHTARKSFEEFIIHYKGSNYIKSALQKIAWCYLLEGNSLRYQEFISRTSCTGTQLVDEDKQAQKEAVSGKAPSPPLLKARLLSDGGYFAQALEILNDKETPAQLISDKDKLEYTYRCGRVLHSLNRISEAIAAYDKTIAEGKTQPWYFAANAAFNLGLIYESKKDFEQARKYYKLCLSMKNHEYRNSLEQKAKAGLSRLP